MLDIKDTNSFLRTYTGERVQIVGKYDVNVCSMGTDTCLPVYIVLGHHSTLLGRNWLAHVQVDWGPIKQIVYHSMEHTIDKYPDIFKEGLGTIKGIKAMTYLNEGVTQRYFKARPVPYSIRGKVEEELDRLLDEKIISPVEFSEWAAPIVPVVKGGGKIRICGDYKVTINNGVNMDSYPLPQIEDILAKLAGGKRFT